ncbi:MAG: hypothetical protein L6Q84_08185 [Polyangiaceae bacterium]|nr:hypothetical protein [Polyangiaceae bacterium]
MSLADDTQALLVGLTSAGVEFIVVGMSAAVAQGVPAVTFDLDIVHRRSDENVDRLMAWLLDHDSFHRFDLANRRLPPTRELLLGTGHVNLQTNLGKLDILCELALGEGYDELVEDTVLVETGSVLVRVLGLPRLIEVKARANRAKDRAVLPLLIATLDELKSRRG